MPTRREWLRKYPGHCTVCEGHTDSAYPCQGVNGVSCLGALICPRCGRLSTEDDESAIDPEDATIPCRVCGWVQDAGMGCPPSREMLRARKRAEKEQETRDRMREVSGLRSRLAELTDLPDCGGDTRCKTHRGGSHNMMTKRECRR